MAATELRYKHRSFSQVKQLRTCGYQFFLERIERVKSRPGAAATAGVATHSGTETVDAHLLAGWTDHEETLRAALEDALTAHDEEIALRSEQSGYTPDDFKVYGFRPRMTIEWYRETGIPNTIKAYLDWRLATPDFEIATIPGFGPAIEVPFNYYIEDQLIHGFIDRIFTSKAQGGYYPVDLKSGKPPATDEQLGLYGAALNKALGWEIEWGYYLHNLRKGEARLTPPLRISHWNDEKLGQVYLPATKLIDLGIYIPTPGDACQFCGVSDACPFSQSVV